MGFIREQEEKLAQRFLTWHCQRAGLVPPTGDDLKKQAARIVTEAHRIAGERGRNVIAIMKELIEDIKKG